MDNYPYSNWRRGPTRIEPIVRKRWLQIAASQAHRTTPVFERLAPLFPTAVAAPTVLHTGFTNANAMLHVANCVANAAKIERGESYKFYSEGVSPAVAPPVRGDQRRARRDRGRRLGRRRADPGRLVRPGVRRARRHSGRELRAADHQPRRALSGRPGTPKSLDHKFVSEDVPTGLMPMRALGAAVGVPTPALDSLITVACILAGRDFAAEARTLERLGLKGLDGRAIRRVVEGRVLRTGNAPSRYGRALDCQETAIERH